MAPSLAYQLKRASLLKRWTESIFLRRSYKSFQGDLCVVGALSSSTSHHSAYTSRSKYHSGGVVEEDRFHPPTSRTSLLSGLAPSASISPSESSRQER